MDRRSDRRRSRSRSPRHDRDHRDKERDTHREKDRESHRDRDRDRDSHRDRERGRDRERDRRSRSRSRSPSYERRRKDRQRKRTSGWDIPPTAAQLAAQQAAAAAAAAAAAGVTQPINPMNQQNNYGPNNMHPSRPMPMQSFQPHQQQHNQSNNQQQHSATRQARRLYIGNLPVPLDESELRVLFNAAFPAGFPHVPPGDCVVSVYLNIEKKFGFVEFRTIEEATMALALDGIMLRGQPLRVKRPSDYQAAMYPSTFRPPPINQAGIAPFMPSNMPSNMPMMQSTNQPINQPNGQLSNQVPDGPNKVFCGGLPYAFGEDEIKELLSSFGTLRAFHLVQDKETGQSRGYCFFEYADSSVTDEAVNSLNNMRIGERTLTVRRAQPKESNNQSNNATAAAMGLISAIQAAGGNVNQLHQSINQSIISPPSRVLVLRNMLSDEELNDPQEYVEVCEEIQSELGKHGRLLHFEIPKPGQAGVGKVFLEYSDIAEAIRARSAVEGREFAGRIVQAEFMDVDKFRQRQF